MKLQEHIVVKKFGGTSVGSIERIRHVADRVIQDFQGGQRPVVVASAMSGETNRLISLGNEVNPGYRGAAYDMLVASGEQVSIALLSMALEERGLKARPFLGFQLGIETDSFYSKARIRKIDSQSLLNAVEQGVVPVIAGFQGIDDHDNITTLGRGGSDTSAVAVAAALGLSCCEIYTDVPAVCTADPRLVSKASEIQRICYEEMLEMASLGSKVLHSRCVELAAKYSTKIHLRSTFEPREGTWIVAEEETMEQPLVTAVTHDESIVVFKLFPVPVGPDFPARLFTKLSDKGIVVDIITQSENEEGQRIAFSTSSDDRKAALECLEELLDGGETEVTVMDELAKVSVVGVGMRNHPGVASRFFSVLAQLKVAVNLITTSEIKISAVIEKSELKRVAEQIHNQFGLDRMA